MCQDDALFLSILIERLESHTHLNTGHTSFRPPRAPPSSTTPPFVLGVWSYRDPRCPPFPLGRVTLVTYEVLAANAARVVPKVSANHVPPVVQLDPWRHVRGGLANHCRKALSCTGQDQMSLAQPPAAVTTA